MSNLEKYNGVFKKMFNVPEEQLALLAYKETAEWNSMAQIALIAELEDTFEIDFDTEDIFSLKSYIIGKEMLSTKFGIEL